MEGLCTTCHLGMVAPSYILRRQSIDNKVAPLKHIMARVLVKIEFKGAEINLHLISLP